MVMEPKWSRDSLATEEEKNWDDESELKGQKKTNELWVLKVFGWIVPIIMVVLALIFVASISAWVLHYLLPVCWHWLSPEQLSKIQSVIFSSSLGAVVTSYAQKKVNP